MWYEDRLAHDVRYDDDRCRDDDRWDDDDRLYDFQYGARVLKDNEILTSSQWNCNRLMRATDKHNQNLAILEHNYSLMSLQRHVH